MNSEKIIDFKKKPKFDVNFSIILDKFSFQLFANSITNTYQQNLSWLSQFGGVNFQASQEQSHSNETYTSSFDFESRSYDPYLIAYHEDTNTFTYNDPWVQMEVVSNDSCSSDYEIIYNVVEETTQNEMVETAPLELVIPPQPIDRHDSIDNEQESAAVPSPSEPEATVEHVAEVSFHRTQLNTRE